MTIPAMTDQDRERALFEVCVDLAGFDKTLATDEMAQHQTFDSLATEVAWKAWQARSALPQQVVAAGSIGDAISQMDQIAIEFAHKMAMHLECILYEYSGKFYDESIDTLGKYRAAMNAIHEQESPTFMGEPFIDARQPAPVKPEGLTYGCHVDLDDGMEPDGCVIDSNRRDDCLYGHRQEKKESCEYWKPVVFLAKQGAGTCPQ